jgi:hypothetical protein
VIFAISHLVFHRIVIAYFRFVIVYFKMSSDDISTLIATVTAMRTESQSNDTNMRAEMKKSTDAMAAMQAAMMAFDVTTKGLQSAIDKNARDNDEKLNKLTNDIKAWADARFGGPGSAAGSADVPMSGPTAAGEHAFKRPRSAGPFERRGPRAGPASASNYINPTFTVWVGGFPRKLPAIFLENAAKAMCTAYLTSGTDHKVLARSMQPGFKIVFEDDADMKNFLQAFRANPHVWTDPIDAFTAVTLRAKVDSTAADRIRISLMTCLWGLISPMLIASTSWMNDRHKLRSQGTSGILWIDNSFNNDGRELLSVRFGAADPTFEWKDDQATKFDILPAKRNEITTRALADWKAKLAVE